MKKIPTLFVRDFDSYHKLVINEVTPGCEWVIKGEGVATRKWDGTCVMMSDDGSWYARREVKPGKEAPSRFIVEDIDETTGKMVGWEPIEQSGFAKFHREAIKQHPDRVYEPGTYELIGPKINRNPEDHPYHHLVEHATASTFDAPRDFDGLVKWLEPFPHEGIVWHHPDGRMAKIKRRDFPLPQYYKSHEGPRNGW